MTRSSFIAESNLYLNIKQIRVTSHHVAQMSWFVRKIARDLPATYTKYIQQEKKHKI